MNRNKEEMFRKFEGHLKILNIRAKFAGDEKAKDYEEMIGKLEQIRTNRHLAMIGEENEESIMYSQLLDVISRGDGQDSEEAMYGNVKQLLNNYSLNTSSKEQKKIDTGEER